MTRDERLVRWLTTLLETPGLTALDSFEGAWSILVEEALAAAELVVEGPVVDVGSGGGSPGIPLATARPELRFDLLEASRRKCTFLREATHELPNVRVVCARAEEHGRGEGRDAYATALARALAPPPVAAEWCLPLVRPGGVAVLYAGRGESDDDRLAAAAQELGAGRPEAFVLPGAMGRRLLVLRKLEPTPARFPRRPGIARKRPLG